MSNVFTDPIIPEDKPDSMLALYPTSLRNGAVTNPRLGKHYQLMAEHGSILDSARMLNLRKLLFY